MLRHRLEANEFFTNMMYRGTTCPWKKKSDNIHKQNNFVKYLSEEIKTIISRYIISLSQVYFAWVVPKIDHKKLFWILWHFSWVIQRLRVSELWGERGHLLSGPPTQLHTEFEYVCKLGLNIQMHQFCIAMIKKNFFNS